MPLPSDTRNSLKTQSDDHADSRIQVGLAFPGNGDAAEAAEEAGSSFASRQALATSRDSL